MRTPVASLTQSTGVPEQAHGVVQGVVGGGGVGLAADVIAGVPHQQVQGSEDLHARGAGRGVAADFGVALDLVRPVVGPVDHGDHVGRRPAHDALKKLEVRGHRSTGK